MNNDLNGIDIIKKVLKNKDDNYTLNFLNIIELNQEKLINRLEKSFKSGDSESGILLGDIYKIGKYILLY